MQPVGYIPTKLSKDYLVCNFKITNIVYSFSNSIKIYKPSINVLITTTSYKAPSFILIKLILTKFKLYSKTNA